MSKVNDHQQAGRSGNGPDAPRLFDRAVARLFRDALRQALHRPRRFLFLLHHLLRQWRAAMRRNSWRRRGVSVPSLLILSVTRRCTLRCAGCYAAHRPSSNGDELSIAELERVVSEARELGVSVVMLAGGEPLLRPDILAITACYPSLIFPLFTNGLALTPDLAKALAKQPHVIPVLSLEGGMAETDRRRGEGVFSRLEEAMAMLSQGGRMFGVSITVTAENHDRVMDPEFAASLVAKGCRLFFYVEFVPRSDEDGMLVLRGEQRVRLPRRLEELQGQLPALFIAFPGDESPYGGCLAAGRGFLHVGPAGEVEPCPFAPYSDVSLREVSLRQALGSEFLQRIRANHALLSEGEGGCSLWANRGRVAGLLPIPPSDPGSSVMEESRL